MGSLDHINTLSEYMGQYGGALTRKVQEEHKPLFAPGEDWSPRLLQALRPPFQGQGDCIMAVARRLGVADDALVVGEMGTGKTLIGTLVPFVMMQHAKTLVMCPPHLTKKWVREIMTTVPGAEASIINSVSDALAVDAEAVVAKGPRYWVLSREKGKLSYRWRPAALKSGYKRTVQKGKKEREIEILLCPRCKRRIVDKDEVPIDGAVLARRKCYCGKCGEALWQADNEGPKRMAIADYLKRTVGKGFFDFAIFDEVHELKGGNTAQGNAFGTLAAIAKKTIGLTGTLLGGYASHLFFMNFRTNPGGMIAQGFEFGKTMKWVQEYGVVERVEKDYEYSSSDNKNSKGRSRSTTVNEKPGISPALFGDQLLSRSVFLHLDDVASQLPPFDEEVVPIRLDPDVELSYKQLQTVMSQANSELLRKGSKRLLGSYLTNLLAYPDKPFGNEPIDLSAAGYKPFQPEEHSEDTVYPKERKMLDLCKSEVEKGRRCLVFAQFTGRRDIAERLKNLLIKSGIRAETLRQNIKPDHREEWVKYQVSEGVQVIVCNPKLVETGLDLLQFPTIIYMQTGYNVFTLRQSSRRSWRIGQTEDVKIFYLYYAGTMQERAVALVGEKLKAAMAIDGKLTDEGLNAMSGSSDMAMELAQSLQKGGSLEGIEATWKGLRQQRNGGMATASNDELQDRDRSSIEQDFQDSDQPDQDDPREAPETCGPQAQKNGGGNSPSRDTKAHERESRVARKPKQTAAWRLDPNHEVDRSEFRWTKAGWRKISQREKDAEARRQANAWKYDPNSVSFDVYTHNKTGAKVLITARDDVLYRWMEPGKRRGHWRKVGQTVPSTLERN